MEARIGAQSPLPYDLGSADLRDPEWDPSHWKWDGHLFVASPVNPDGYNCRGRQFFPLQSRAPLAGTMSNSSSSCSDELNLGPLKDDSDFHGKRRIILLDDDEQGHLEGESEAGALTLKLGRRGYPSKADEREVTNWETSAKKTKLSGNTSGRAVCQVQDCGADLSKAKDYHRRHKVCEMHSKASRALVGNVVQRFCQQCSRFHALQEFDEGKRSCRRRLAGHNKRRRKVQPDGAANNSSLKDNQASGYLLMSLLRILSNIHPNKTSHKGDQNLLSHLLRSLADQGAKDQDKFMKGLQGSPKLLHSGPSLGNPEMTSTPIFNFSDCPQEPKHQSRSSPGANLSEEELHQLDASIEDPRATHSRAPVITSPIQDTPPLHTRYQDGSGTRNRLNNFDLNDVYVDSDDGLEEIERSPIAEGVQNGSLGCPSWMQLGSQQSSPPQTSGNSVSASPLSPSSSSGDAQSRTDRIVFKLFGKEPSDFPYLLRAQILDWLSHSPTDIESYIRPGCTILTIYLRLPVSLWEEISSDLNSSLRRLLEVTDHDAFWRTGWIFLQVQNQIAFICNGQVIMSRPVPFNLNDGSHVFSIKPIATPISERVMFTVKSSTLSRCSGRLLCSLEGNYLAPDSNGEFADQEQHNLQSMKFSCHVPAITGRGFIEVEDHGICGSFFPFIVAEKDICSEIRMLENELESSEAEYLQEGTKKLDRRNQALDFIHEIGWLLRRNQLKSKMNLESNVEIFSVKRFIRLMEFSVDHEWCAVVRKLLDILFDGTIVSGNNSFLKFTLTEMGLVHQAVRRNSRPLVELLLRYAPSEIAEELSAEYHSLTAGGGDFLFRPDTVGPADLTPLHVAAGRDGSEDVLDALTADPGKVGIEAWKTARDSTGFSPEDYARLRGHYSYIHLVQRKINREMVTGYLVVDIPNALPEASIHLKQDDGLTVSFEVATSESKSTSRPCQHCCRGIDARSMGSRSHLYRPAMLAMVAIAAVCVCVALLFKSSPEVLYVFQPFRWEMLDYGSS